jgi:glutamate/tyrosine decarboxylase-like PLP-dependent enzyme
MSFKRYGAHQIGEWIDNNVRQAKHLYSLVEKHPEFEAASAPPMSAICIRFKDARLGEAESKQLHAKVAQRVEQSGHFWLSTTELNGKTWFRINPVNFRTREEHMEQLFFMLQEESRAVLKEKGTSSHASY